MPESGLQDHAEDAIYNAIIASAPNEDADGLRTLSQAWATIVFGYEGGKMEKKEIKE